MTSLIPIRRDGLLPASRSFKFPFIVKWPRWSVSEVPNMSYQFDGLSRFGPAFQISLSGAKHWASELIEWIGAVTIPEVSKLVFLISRQTLDVSNP